MSIADWFRGNGPKLISYAAVLVIGVAVGWGLKPDQVRVEEKVRVELVEKEVVVVQEQVRVEVVKVKDTQVVERWHREKTETKSPDGTVVTREVEDRNVDSVVRERENTVEVKVVEVTKEVVVEKEVVKDRVVTPVLAQWHLGILGGVQKAGFTNLDFQGVFGVEMERRLVGPLFAGAWATVNTDFKQVNGVGAGLKLGLEF